MEIFKILGRIAVENDEANNSIDETKGKASNASTKIVNAFKKVGTAVATYFAAEKIATFGKTCLNAAADAQAMESQFGQVFGWILADGEDLEVRARESLSRIADEAGISENRMKGSFTKIAAFANTTGMSSEESLELTERAMVAVADSAAFYDRTLEETTESLQSFLKGNYENDAALGLSCTETTRNAAANELYGKSFNELSESQKQLTLLKMVEDANELSGALGQAARESDTWTNQTGNLKQSWTDLQAVLGKPVLGIAVGIVGKLADKIGGLVERFEEGDNPVQIFIEKIQSVWTWLQEVGDYASNSFQPVLENLETAWTTIKDAVQPFIDKLTEYVTSGEATETVTNAIKDAIDKLSEAASTVWDALVKFSAWCSEHQTLLETIAIVIGSIAAAWVLVNGAIAIWNGICVVASAVTSAFGAALSFLTSPITLVILAIGAVIAIIVLCVKHWDEISAKVKEVWANIVAWVTGAIESVKAKIEEWKTNLTNKFNEIKDNVTEKITQLKDNITEKFTAIKDSISEKLTAVFDFITTTWTNIRDGIAGKISEVKENLATKFEEIRANIEEKITAVKDKITEIWTIIKEFVAETISNVKANLIEKFTAIKDSISEKLTAAKEIVMSIWTNIRDGVADKISAIKENLAEKFDTIKSNISDKLTSAKETVVGIFDEIKTAISDKIESAKETVNTAIEKIKGFFDFNWSLPTIKLPHFSISGSFSLNPPSIPHFGVEWYKEGGVMTDPTAFGINPNSGKMMVGGEAGAEAIAPIDVLQGYVAQAVASQNEALVSILERILEAIITMDDNMGGNLREALDGTAFTVNKREFARLVKAVT